MAKIGGTVSDTSNPRGRLIAEAARIAEEEEGTADGGHRPSLKVRYHWDLMTDMGLNAHSILHM